MKKLKVIGTALFVFLLAIAWVLVIGFGVAAIALCDFVRFLGRQTIGRLRGERPSNHYVPVPYNGPYPVMDADGFVEPPEPAPAPMTKLALVPAPVMSITGRPRVDGFSASSNRVVPSYSSSPSRRTGSFGRGMQTGMGSGTVVDFPADAAARERLIANRARQDSRKIVPFPVDSAARERLKVNRNEPGVPVASDKVIVLSQRQLTDKR